MEPRLNRPARATTAQGFCWVFLPSDKHVVHQDSNSALQQLSLSQAHFINPCFTDGNKIWEIKGQKEEAWIGTSDLPPLILVYQDMGMKRSFISLLWGHIRCRVKSTFSEIPVTWDLSLTQSRPQCMILGRLLPTSLKPVFLHVKWG